MDNAEANTPLIRREPQSGLSSEDRTRLAEAIRNLRASRGLVVRGADLLAGVFGVAANAGVRGARLSPLLGRKIRRASELALRRAFDVAVLGLRRPRRRGSKRGARLAVAASGAIGGFTGLVGFMPDVAFTTLVVMRTIAEIARAEGEDLATEASRQACLEVFAFGGAELGLEEDTDISYWSARLVFQGRPLVLLFSEIAGRYGLQVSQKLALQAMPLVGAAGGALVNSVFFQHYRAVAQVHFVIRRLERQYGPEAVRREAVAIARQLRGPDEPFVSGAPA